MKIQVSYIKLKRNFLLIQPLSQISRRLYSESIPCDYLSFKSTGDNINEGRQYIYMPEALPLNTTDIMVVKMTGGRIRLDVTTVTVIYFFKQYTSAVRAHSPNIP
jgi:hypothetical protein